MSSPRKTIPSLAFSLLALPLSLYSALPTPSAQAATVEASELECGAATVNNNLGRLLKELRYQNGPATPGVRRLVTEQLVKLRGERSYELLQEIPMYNDTLDIHFQASQLPAESQSVEVAICTTSTEGNQQKIDGFKIVTSPTDNSINITRKLENIANERISIRLKGGAGTKTNLVVDLQFSLTEGQPWTPLDKISGQDPVKGFADLHLHQTGAMAFNEGWYWGSHEPGSLEDRLPNCDGKHASYSQFEFVLKVPYVQSLLYSAAGKGNVDDFLRSHHHITQRDHYVRSDDRKHQQVAFERLKQAHERGLSLIVSTTVENLILSYLMKATGKGSDELTPMSMESIKRQIISLRKIDDQTDWFEVVLDPWHARRVINQGKLAVVIGAEFSDIFPASDGPWKQQLHDLYDLGLRHLQPVHKIDSRFNSTHDQGFPFDNFNTFQALTRPEIPDGPALERTRAGVTDPVEGLSQEGRELIDEMVRLNMIVDLSHSSTSSQNEATDILIEKHSYYPIFYSHWAARQPLLLDELKQTGGMIAFGWGQPVPSSVGPSNLRNPIIQNCPNHLSNLYQSYKDFVDFGVNFSIGTDLNGFTSVTSPNFGPDACLLSEEEKSRDDQVATFNLLKQRYPNHPEWVVKYWAQGTADISLVPGILYDLREILGVNTDAIDESVEAFIQMWERTYDNNRTNLLASGS